MSFFRRSLDILNPGSRFFPNWHINAMAHALDQVRQGKIKRLIINLPPRHLKSSLVTVALPPFILGHDPTRRIFAVSYSGELSVKHALDSRAIMQADWYQRIFPRLRISRSLVDETHTTQRGFRKALSVYGTITGLGGNLFIIDDPQKPTDALSDIERGKMIQWYSNTLLSRLDNKESDAIIVVTQRVHLGDLSGYLIEAGGWTVLNLPAIADSDERIEIGNGKFYPRKAGEALHPDYEPLRVLEQLKVELGTDVFSAQYQQRPAPPGGAMIKRDWLRYYTALPDRKSPGRIIQSWDTAAKAGAQNDWSVCTTWLVLDNNFYLIDLTRGRYEYPQLKATAINLAQRHKPQTIIIEDASTGAPLAQELRQEWRLGASITLVPIEHDKRARV